MIMKMAWIALVVLILQTPDAHSVLNGLTNYVPVTTTTLDMLFIFDSANDELFEQAKLFTVDTLAAADINGDLVRVGLMTLHNQVFYLHKELDNDMNKDTLINVILNLTAQAPSSILITDFEGIFSETNGGRLYVKNITVAFVSNYTADDITNGLQILQNKEFDSEVNIVGLQLYNATNMMSYSSHTYITEDIKQLGSFTATIFFQTFTDDCQYNRPIQTTTASVPPVEALTEWEQNTRDNLILDTALLSSTIRKKTSASDSRTSSTLIGSVGLIIVLTTFLLPIITDIPTFIRDVKLSIKYQKKYRRKMDKLKAGMPH
ncbi:uncharacterized protein LOC132554690 [Ylistrum balloti]|uniref:uncharacterized protein LOC132554690 n=1 Tax=Ylistrum balloti TaxID=509963 RepID=UPI002905F236|nr:uncharacterized protein LOC132554690 [Ylistrum balloti]